MSAPRCTRDPSVKNDVRFNGVLSGLVTNKLQDNSGDLSLVFSSVCLSEDFNGRSIFVKIMESYFNILHGKSSSNYICGDFIYLFFDFSGFLVRDINQQYRILPVKYH